LEPPHPVADAAIRVQHTMAGAISRIGAA
jgi:hypothetical protein